VNNIQRELHKVADTDQHQQQFLSKQMLNIN
jgi:hypothetical protein